QSQKNADSDFTISVLNGFSMYLLNNVLYSIPVQAVPYRSFISGGLRPGKTITIQGTAHPNATRSDLIISFTLKPALQKLNNMSSRLRTICRVV
uniref:Galectin n=1 Tax=Acanthochromis polyacanthus TaxID=80966 RepID=A0A3Q1EET0_9TELE